MDKIFIKQLEVDCIIGIFKRERVAKQRVWIDLEIPCDARKPAFDDSIKKAINYKRIAKVILKFTTQSKYHLIETLAEALANKIISDFRLPWVTLTVSKPGAIRFSQNVGITITRYSKTVSPVDSGELIYVSVGSNLDKERKIKEAIHALGEEFNLSKMSAVYESSAVGCEGVDPFWNLMVEASTPKSPTKVKESLSRLESMLGRKKTKDKFASRLVDLDLIFHSTRIVNNGKLRVPHPDALHAPYILVPMAEICPNFVHPEEDRTISEMLGEKLDPQGHFRKIKNPMLG